MPWQETSGSQGGQEGTGPDKPWSRQPSETGRQWELFSRYLAMGPSRTLARVCAEFGLRPKYVQSVSSERKWTSRAMGYEADFDRRVSSYLERSRTRRELLDAGNREAASRLVRLQIKRYLRLSIEDKSFAMKVETIGPPDQPGEVHCLGIRKSNGKDRHGQAG